MKDEMADLSGRSSAFPIPDRFTLPVELAGELKPAPFSWHLEDGEQELEDWSWRSVPLLDQTSFTRALQKLLPCLIKADLQPGGPGVRAQALDSS